MLPLTAGPGFRLTSPANSRINTNLNVGLEWGIGSNFRLKIDCGMADCVGMSRIFFIFKNKA